MLGLMQQTPLLISSLIRHAEAYHGETEIVSRRHTAELERSSWSAVAARARRVASMLEKLGVGPGERVATIAWNRLAHLELYYGITGAGSILHTVNPRLFPEQISYIINHAEDKYVFVDPDLIGIAETAAPELPHVEGWVVLCRPDEMPETSLPNVVCFEDLMEAADDSFDWPILDEASASTLCYTSGTTGNPKGVLYSHRSTVLHAFCAATADGLALTSRDSVLLATPLFHVNAWGLPFAAAMAGVKLVLPGSALDGEAIFTLLTEERCTFSLGVPTLWFAVLDFIERHVPVEQRSALCLERVVSGGAAVPRSMIERFDKMLGVDVIQAWGMTETSPLATINRPLAKHRNLDDDARYELRSLQGRPAYGIELRLVDDEGNVLPHDGKAVGELHVRGPWVAASYFKSEGGAVCDKEGWFATGDIARISKDGFLQITDRSKDVIKSGGEWISSIDLENAATSHPSVAEAAVIGVSHPRWQERPLLLVRCHPGAEVTKDEMLAHLEDLVAKWWLPDDVLPVDELPHTATGKLLKTKLREEYRDHLSGGR